MPLEIKQTSHTHLRKGGVLQIDSTKMLGAAKRSADLIIQDHAIQFTKQVSWLQFLAHYMNIPMSVGSLHLQRTLGWFPHCEFLPSRMNSRMTSLSQSNMCTWITYWQAKARYVSKRSTVLLSGSKGLHPFRGAVEQLTFSVCPLTLHYEDEGSFREPVKAGKGGSRKLNGNENYTSLGLQNGW